MTKRVVNAFLIYLEMMTIVVSVNLCTCIRVSTPGCRGLVKKRPLVGLGNGQTRWATSGPQQAMSEAPSCGALNVTSTDEREMRPPVPARRIPRPQRTPRRLLDGSKKRF